MFWILPTTNTVCKRRECSLRQIPEIRKIATPTVLCSQLQQQHTVHRLQDKLLNTKYTKNKQQIN
jgi:hypothetical protein